MEYMSLKSVVSVVALWQQNTQQCHVYVFVAFTLKLLGSQERVKCGLCGSPCGQRSVRVCLKKTGQRRDRTEPPSCS